MLCKCGCGQELPNYIQNKKFIYGHRKKFIKVHKNETIRCACGCNQQKLRYDQGGVEHLYLQGHNPASEKQKAIRAKLNRQRKGKFKHKPESKQKTSQSLIAFYKNNPIPQERRDKISKSKKGWNPTNKTRHNMSIAAKKRLEDPTNHSRYGITVTQETREAISLSLIKYYEENPSLLTGENNPMWCGGISFEPYGIEFNEKLRQAIRKRDNYTCQLCNEYGNFIHHINYIKTDNRSENLITLRNNCHSATNYNRNLWMLYFILRSWVGQALISLAYPLIPLTTAHKPVIQLARNPEYQPCAISSTGRQSVISALAAGWSFLPTSASSPLDYSCSSDCRFILFQGASRSVSTPAFRLGSRLPISRLSPNSERFSIADYSTRFHFFNHSLSRSTLGYLLRLAALLLPRNTYLQESEPEERYRMVHRR